MPNNGYSQFFMFKDFKSFIMRGNVMDLAVGVIIGGAFSKIVTSFVNDLITPFISALIGGISFSGLKTKIGGTEAAPIYLTYGQFLQAVIDFLLIAVVIFVMVKAINSLHEKKPVEVTTKDCQYCFSHIPKAATRCPNCTSQL